jgi:hypothetical protein
MKIYLSGENCRWMANSFSGYMSKDRLEYIVDHKSNMDLLERKDLILIDVFNTFIQPTVDIYDDITLDRGGIVEFVKTRPVRDGFREFIDHYHGLGKTIGIHSNSFIEKEFERASDYWNFGSSIDRYFGKEFMIYNFFEDPKKDFNKMIEQFGKGKDETLIIGDGGSDIMPALDCDVDILLVPTFFVDKEFDYRSLIR